MSLVPIFEIHQRRIIPFPEELLQGKGAFPLRCKLYLGLTAAAMLFPRDSEDFAGYMAQEMTFLISQMEMMEVEFQKKAPLNLLICHVTSTVPGQIFCSIPAGKDFLRKEKDHSKSEFCKVKFVDSFTCSNLFQKKRSKNPLNFSSQNLMKYGAKLHIQSPPCFLLVIFKIISGRASRMWLGCGHQYVIILFLWTARG